MVVAVTDNAELIERLREMGARTSIFGRAADALAAADARIADLRDECKDVVHYAERAEKAESALAQARRDALEEAARECEAQIIMSDYPRTLGDAAAAIRSLIYKQKGRRHPEG